MITISVQNTAVPALGFGTWQLRGQDCADAVGQALETGYRHIDTAQMYDNEDAVGTGLRESRISRDEIFLTTKVWMDRVGQGALQKSVEESLKKLKTDYVDLLLIHWPVNNVPFPEQLKGLEDVHKAGRTKLIGVSNFTVAQMKEVVEKIGAKIVTNQVEYHPFLSQQPVLDYIRSQGMFLTAYSPLARGTVRENPVLQELGLKYGKTPGQITLRWLVQQPNVAAIPKAASPQNIEANFNIFDFTLSDEDMAKIHALAKPDGRMVNPNWSPAWDKVG